MLRTSRINPNLSAHEQIHGTHDFNATPLARPGTRCIAHEKSSQRGTWAPHGQPGWYVGAAPEHYRCYQIYIPKTQGTRICDTVEFFPTHCTMPHVTANDAAIYAANDLITALTKPQPPHSFLSLGKEQLAALQKLANIFQRAVNKPPMSAPGVPDLTPPPRPRTRSQTKSFANAAYTIHNHNHQPQSTPTPPEQKNTTTTFIGTPHMPRQTSTEHT